jgi:hypothetical protein
MHLTGSGGELVVADDTLRLDGVFSQQETFDPALSSGSYHPDWFSSMLPDIVEAFNVPGLAGRPFEEGAECLRVIRAAYASAAALSGSS